MNLRSTVPENGRLFRRLPFIPGALPGGRLFTSPHIPFVTLPHDGVDLESGMLTRSSEVFLIMQTQFTPAMPTLQASHPAAVIPVNPDRVIAISVNVDADARRISQALTEPEYLEAWIRVPDQSAGSSLIASRHENGYRLEHSRAGQVDVRITGSYLFRHQRKMRLAWRRADRSFSTNSIVDFRVRGNFGSSILELRHTALASPAEFEWHQKLWQNSLPKLAALLHSA